MAEPSEAAWQKVQLYAQRLVEALGELDDAGGLKALAPSWRPATRDKARAAPVEARRALDGALAQLKASSSPPKPSGPARDDPAPLPPWPRRAGLVVAPGRGVRRVRRLTLYPPEPTPR
jgi:hypothetical protein